MRHVTGHILGAWARVEAAAGGADALSNPSALLGLLCLHPRGADSGPPVRATPNGELIPSDAPGLGAEVLALAPRFESAADSLARALHGIWAVARRCTALELRAAAATGGTRAAAGSSPAAPPSLSDPSVLAIVHPFLPELWATVLPGVLRLLAALHGLWGSEATRVLLAHPLLPVDGGGSGPPSAGRVAARLVARGLYCFSAEEAAALGAARQPQQQQTHGGDGSGGAWAEGGADAPRDDEDLAPPSTARGPLGAGGVVTRLPVLIAAAGGSSGCRSSNSSPVEWGVSLPAPAAAALAAASRRASQLCSRVLWHAYAVVALALRGHLVDPGALQRVAAAGDASPAAAGAAAPPPVLPGGAGGGGSAAVALGGYDAAGGVFRIPASAAAAAQAAGATGPFSAALGPRTAPLLAAVLAPAALRALPLRVLRALTQQLLAAVVQGVPPQPPALLAAAAAAVVPALAVAMQRSTAAVARAAAGGIGPDAPCAVWDADFGALWLRQEDDGGADGGRRPASSPAAPLPRERVAVECGRAVLDVVLQLLPLPPPHGPPLAAPPGADATSLDEAAGGGLLSDAEPAAAAGGGGGRGENVCALTVCVLTSLSTSVAVVDGGATSADPLPLALARLLVGALALRDSGAVLRACTAWERVIAAWESLGSAGGPLAPGAPAAAVWASAAVAFVEGSLRYLCARQAPGDSSSSQRARHKSGAAPGGGSGGGVGGAPDETSELSLVLALIYVRLAAVGALQPLATLLASLPGSGGPSGVAALEARLLLRPPAVSAAGAGTGAVAGERGTRRAVMRDFLQTVTAAVADAAAGGGGGGWPGSAASSSSSSRVLDLSERLVMPPQSRPFRAAGAEPPGGPDALSAAGGLRALFGDSDAL